MTTSLLRGGSAALLLATLAAPSLSAQVTAAPDTAAAAGVPPGLVRVEEARSRACVGLLAEVDVLNRDLAPLTMRAQRIRMLERAVALEDSTDVLPWDTTAVDARVREWFRQDGALAARWVAERDTAIQAQRANLKESLRQELRRALEGIAEQGRARMETAGDVQGAARLCDGAVLVRQVVLKECAAATGPVCEAASQPAGAPSSPFRFVDAATDIWDIEEFRPWSDPQPLRVGPDGGLAGARVGARARRGNVTVTVVLSPMLRRRSDLGPERAAEFDANLDSLGFTFDHPDFVMAPSLEVSVHAGGVLGGETHYLLHFGDLSDPARDVVFSAPVPPEGFLQAAFPVVGPDLARLQGGEPLSLTAVHVEEAGGTQHGEPVYSITIPAVNQARSAGALLGYMAGGQLGRDLAAIIPPRDSIGAR